jgi:hypothetical protein
MTEDDVRNILAPYGQIRKIVMKGHFAFVDLDSVERYWPL